MDMQSPGYFWLQEQEETIVEMLRRRYSEDKIYRGETAPPVIIGDTVLAVDNLIVDGEVPTAIRYFFSSSWAASECRKILVDSSCWQIVCSAVRKYIHFLNIRTLEERILGEMKIIFYRTIAVSPEFDFSPYKVEFLTTGLDGHRVTAIVATIKVSDNPQFMPI